MARIIQIGKRSWLAGMTWTSYEDAPSKVELKEDALRLKSSWACVRIGEDAIQAGYCAPIENVKGPSKLYSLAAMLADSREQPWLGIFKIEEGVWWYVAVRDGHAILPDGDVIGGEAEIHAARERHSGYTDWKYIDGDISLLGEFIDSIEAKPTPIRSLVGRTLPIVPIVVATLVSVSAIGGGYWWWHSNQIQQEQERVAAMAAMRAQMLAGQQLVVVPSPLLTTPKPNDWLAACGSAISPLPLSRDGWVLDQVACADTSAVIHWVRQEGATVANKPEGNLSPDGNAVDQVVTLTALKSGSDDAIDLPAAKLALRAWAQAANFALTMNEVAPVPTLPGATPQSQPAAQVPQATVAFDIPVSPFGLDMSSIRGLRLTSLKSTANVWTVGGTLYGR